MSARAAELEGDRIGGREWKMRKSVYATKELCLEMTIATTHGTNLRESRQLLKYRALLDGFSASKSASKASLNESFPRNWRVVTE